MNAVIRLSSTIIAIFSLTSLALALDPPVFQCKASQPFALCCKDRDSENPATCNKPISATLGEYLCNPELTSYCCKNIGEQSQTDSKGIDCYEPNLESEAVAPTFDTAALLPDSDTDIRTVTIGDPVFTCSNNDQPFGLCCENNQDKANPKNCTGAASGQRPHGFCCGTISAHDNAVDGSKCTEGIAT